MLLTTALAVFLIAWSSIFLFDYVLRLKNYEPYIRFSYRVGLEVSPLQIRFYLPQLDPSSITLAEEKRKSLGTPRFRFYSLSDEKVVLGNLLTWLWFCIGVIASIVCLFGITIYLSHSIYKDVSYWASLRPRTTQFRGINVLGKPLTTEVPPKSEAPMVFDSPNVVVANEDNDVFDSGQKGNGGLIPIIPGFNLPWEHLPVFMLVLIISTLVHEFGHARAATTNNIRVNGFGLFLFGVYPGAFTDVDTQSLKRSTVFQRLMVFGAGIWHNLMLALLAYLIFLSTPSFFAPLYVEGRGVTVRAVDKQSGLNGANGLRAGDVVVAINDCDVAFGRDWLRCIQRVKDQKTGYCVPSDRVLAATSFNKWISTDEVHCCDEFNVSSAHVCFEREELEKKELTSHAPQLNALLGIESRKDHPKKDETVKVTKHSCLNARYVLEQATCNETAPCAKAENANLCVYPALFNGTQLVKIKTKNKSISVLYVGHLDEMLQLVEVHSWTPSTSIFGFELIDGVQLFAKYLFTISLALGLVNALPCYALDGQYILTTLLVGMCISARKRRAIRSVVLLLGSILLFANIVAGWQKKRKLLAEIDKCYKKIDEGVELFEDTMQKMQEANSDNQRDKYQDDLKKEIKKLQRLRDQVKGWQNSSDIKDKEKLNQYRKLIEGRMEQFKDIERENKTKPHSKQGLCAEEKLDPKEKERYDAVDWIQNLIRELNDEADRTEMLIESLTSSEVGKKRGKKDELKKGEKEKKVEELKKHLERMKFHLGKLEICMRMINNESLEPKVVIDVLKEQLETYIDLFDPDNEDKTEIDLYDPEDVYDELKLDVLTVQLGGINLSSIDDDQKENGQENGLEGEEKSSRHNSSESPASPAGRRNPPHSATSIPPSPSSILGESRAKLTKEPSLESPTSPAGFGKPSEVAANVATTTAAAPPPPGIPYNSVAAGRPSASATSTPTIQPRSAASSPLVVAPSSPSPPAAPTTPPVAMTNESYDAKSDSPAPARLEDIVPSVVATPALSETSERTSVNGDINKANNKAANQNEESLRVLRLSQNKPTTTSTEPKRAHIPAWLGASPLGRAPSTNEYEVQMTALELALMRTTLPLDSERPRTYLPKIVCPSPHYYAQTAPANSDSLEYYLRLSPDTLFFIFYYMEGTRAQLLAAKALKKLSWRFHTKYLTWFQRHEEPKQITDDYEQGTYVYFDFEKWSQRKKESFTFEYKFLEDKEFD
ncbi:unnamed protein product [Caenorhabditis auriculariae]|uniref:Membrane-bound transcription factor site-2 protease n=1 Tax=Caenorhabditis auriculariae TaxID=2777116 RepID=A0A8S1GXB3_9PELO|nr:unnamed protein product [Caenorhabditis auriculariae]